MRVCPKVEDEMEAITLLVLLLHKSAESIARRRSPLLRKPKGRKERVLIKLVSKGEKRSLLGS